MARTGKNNKESSLAPEAQQMLELLNLAGQSLVSLDSDGIICVASDTLNSLIGTSDSVVGKRFLQWIAPEWQQKIEDWHRDCFMQKAEITNVFPLIDAQGKERWVQQTVLRTSAGESPILHSILQDIPGKQDSEDALREREARYKGIFQSSIDALLILRGHQIKDANRAAETLLRADHHTLLKHPAYLWIIQSERERIRAYIEAISSEPINTQLLLSNKQTIPVELRLTPLADDHCLLIVRDLREYVAMDRTLQLRNRALEASLSGICIVDACQPNLPLIYVNPAFERITGYSSEEVLGRNCRFLQRNDRDQPELDVVRQALTEEKGCDVVLRNYRKDGTLFWNELRIAPIHADNGQLTHYVGALTDITARKQIEDALAQERNRLLTIIDQIPDSIHAKDADGFYALSNVAHTRLLGVESPDEIIGKRSSDFFPPHLAEQYEDDDEHILTTGETVIHTEMEGQDSTGQTRWFFTSKVAMRDMDDRITGVIAIARDVTEQRNIDVQIRRREALYRTLARNLPNTAVFLFNDDLRFLLAEGQALFEVNFSSGEIEGRVFDEIIPRAPKALRDQYLKIFDGVEQQRVYNFSGKLFNVHSLPVYNEEGDIFAGMTVARDITAEYEAEAALQASEQRQRAILDTLPDMMYVLNREGICTAYHASAMADLGSEDIVGKHIGDIGLPIEIVEENLTYSTLALETERIQSFEYVLMKNAQPEYFEARMVALNLDEVLTLVRNITPLKRVQEELSKHIEDLTILRQIEAEISDTLKIGAVVRMALDAAMRQAKANTGYIALMRNNELELAYVIGDTDSSSIEDILHQTDGIITRTISEQRSILIHDLSDVPDYHPMLTSTRAAILMPLVSQERVVGLLNLETNRPERFDVETFEFLQLITSRIASMVDNANLYHQTEQQLEELTRLYEQVRKLEQLKTDMIRIASHDLRNPLAAISGYLELLKADLVDMLDQDQTTYLSQINQATRRMQRIVTGILSLERIEQMALEGSDNIFDLAELIRRTISEYGTSAQQKRIALEKEITGGKVWVLGDPIQLHEAIANLVSNAIKYTPQDGQVTIRLQTESEQAILQIIDTGYGIPEAQQKQLFTPFFRARMKETEQIEGTGLGLHLVRNIIERHNGEMIFRSQQGKGSTFGFRLALTDRSEREEIGPSTIVG